MKEITREIVRELLDYDPETGVLTWRERGAHWFNNQRAQMNWNRARAGKRAGGVQRETTGYECRVVRLLGRLYREHRVVWLYVTSEPLPPEIDHINRDATDNRWLNLRSSDRAQNNRNRSKRRTSSSGVTGVSWFEVQKKWHARCTISGKTHHIGYFTDLDEAGTAVKEFRLRHGFDHGHGEKTAHYHRADSE